MSLAISTPNPLIPDIRMLEAFILRMASWPNTYLKHNVHVTTAIDNNKKSLYKSIKHRTI